MIPIKHVRNLDLIVGTPESPQEHCQKSRRTLMSQQKCDIARFTSNQLEMKPSSPVMAPEPSHNPHHTRQFGLTSFSQLQRFLETPVSSLEDHQYQHSNSRKAPCTPNHLEMRADSLDMTEEVCQLSTST